MKTSNRISIIGLGKIGASFLVAIASRGFQVIGLDIDNKKIKKIDSGQAPVFEPLLQKYLKKYKNRIKTSNSYKEVVNNSQISFIIVSTPSTKNGSFSNKFVSQAIKKIGQALKEKKSFHLVALMSTVSPGSIEKNIKPALFQAAGKKIGQEIGLCYNPGFVALGSVINDFLKPEFVLIGQSDKKSGDLLKKFYQRFCLNKPPIIRMNFINAEITKLALNTYITTKISYANMLAELCEKTPGTDVHKITQVIGLDSRIGQKYLQGAVAYGGPCFPRDNRALRAFAKSLNFRLPLALATDKVNNQQTKAIIKLIKNNLGQKGRVAVLGLAYKGKTDVAEESQGIKLSLELVKQGYRVTVHDPKALKSAKVYLGNKVTYLDSVDQLEQVDLLVITTKWDIYLKKLPKILKKKRLNPIIIDCWQILKQKQLPVKIKYLVRGKHS